MKQLASPVAIRTVSGLRVPERIEDIMNLLKLDIARYVLWPAAYIVLDLEHNN